MKTIVLSVLLALAIPCAGQQLQQCFLSTVVSGGTQSQSVNIANFNPTASATTAVGGWGFVITEPCSTSGIAYEVIAADMSQTSASNLYVIGIYCISGDCIAGRLYATTTQMPASVFAPLTARGLVVTQPWIAATVGPPPITLVPGLYMLAVGVNGCTTTNLCPILAAETSRGMIYPFFATNVGNYSNGLPPSIKPPSIQPTANTSIGTKAMLEVFIY